MSRYQTFCVDQTMHNVSPLTAENLEQTYDSRVNIFASGASISTVSFNEDMLTTPAYFMNGSITLTQQHDFKNVAGYVISDARFVKHHPEILMDCYQGQPLYATPAVFAAMAKDLPDVFAKHASVFRIIHPVDRPWGVAVNATLWQKLTSFIRQTKLDKKPLTEFVNHSDFIIDATHQPQPIGVSLDVTQGFVEAGTVAYVVTQLAFTKGYGKNIIHRDNTLKDIHIYGVDLLNTSKPRFYEDNDNQAPCKLEKAVNNRIVPSFRLLQKVYDEYGVSVVNESSVSRGLF